MATTIFKNVRVFDGEDIHQSANVVVKDGKISSVSSSPPSNVEADATTVDGAGHTLLPGLIEAHMHAHLHTGEGTVQPVSSSLNRITTLGALDHY
jgi:imidazolonepropionase-like amidohydrolase